MKKWHSMTEDEVISELNTSPDGLSDGDAAERLARDGQNKLDETKKHGLIYKFLIQFKNVMVIVLLAAAAVAAAVAIFERDPSELVDSGIILAIVLLNAVIGVVQENKAESALDALNDMAKPYAKVRRNGETLRIAAVDIVVGDVVILEAGDSVPADIRLTECASLKIEEAAMTGESVPSEKSTEICAAGAALGDRKNMAFASGTVTYGRGEGIVVATGMRAEMGKIAGMLQSEKAETTPIQKKLNKTGKFLSIAVLVIAAVIFAISLIGTGFELHAVVDAFMTAVAIAVAAIPEGLTAVITIIMAIGVQKMSKKNAIIRKLPAVETLGSTEIICSDKTGTLTLNRMTVKAAVTADGEAESGETFLQLINCMTLCNDTSVTSANGEFKTIGDPTETALVTYAKGKGFDKRELDVKFARTDEIPFDSDRKLMTVVTEYDGGRRVYTKGAPDMLIGSCTKIMEGGKVRALTDADREKIARINSSLSRRALRMLAFAMREDVPDSRDEYETELTFIGVVGMIDPPREEAKTAVATCKRAGMRAVMITGDHRDTAFAIAKELGIADSEAQVITGRELSEMTDAELEKCVGKYNVYARVSPEHKVRIVKAWKKNGKVVAMTGDGVNDAPGIKAADIGIGMGITGTDVTKGAADMVLADDNFATIVLAVEEGRKIYANMQKTIQFLLSANVAEVLALFLATIFFRGYTFLFPIQILWINLITDCLPALALGMEEAEPDIMNRKPRKDSANLFAGHVGANILYQGAIQTILVLGVYIFSFYVYAGADNSHEIATTMAFITLAFVQLFHCFNAKSLNGTIFHKNLFKNKMMLISLGVGVALTLAVSLIPFLASAFRLVPLTWYQWLISVGMALAVIPLVEIGKVIARAVVRRRSVKTGKTEE